MACASPFLARGLGLLLLLAELAACLPDDTRPPPGRLAVTVTADDDMSSGITTSDGWEIAFDRFWLSLGEVRIVDERCNSYAEGYYVRILDMLVPGPQTVATLHALGQCELGFVLVSPPGSGEDVVLGSGVGADVATFMGTAGSDAFVDNGRVVLHVEGTATRSGTTITFSWSFRQTLDYLCDTIDFQSGESRTADIRIRGRALFQDDLDDATARLRFDPYAGADRDGDDDITLDELGTVSLPVGGSFETLAGHLYLGLVARVPRFRDEATCFVGEIAAD